MSRDPGDQASWTVPLTYLVPVLRMGDGVDPCPCHATLPGGHSNLRGAGMCMPPATLERSPSGCPVVNEVTQGLGLLFGNCDAWPTAFSLRHEPTAACHGCELAIRAARRAGSPCSAQPTGPRWALAAVTPVPPSSRPRVPLQLCAWWRVLVVVHVCVQISGARPWGEWTKLGSRAFPVGGDGVTQGESPGGLGTGPGPPAAGVWPEGKAHTPAAMCRSPQEACSLPRRPAPAASFLVADTAPLVVAWRVLSCLSRGCCAYLLFGPSLPLWLWVAKCDTQSPALGPLEALAVQRALQLGARNPTVTGDVFSLLRPPTSTPNLRTDWCVGSALATQRGYGEAAPWPPACVALLRGPREEGRIC